VDKLLFAVVLLWQSETFKLDGKSKEIEKERFKISFPKMQQVVFLPSKTRIITKWGILLNSSTSVLNTDTCSVKHGYPLC
jgi:hypothetical protein